MSRTIIKHRHTGTTTAATTKMSMKQPFSDDGFQDEMIVEDGPTSIMEHNNNGGVVTLPQKEAKKKTKMERVLSSIVPEINPMTWFLINVFCLFGSTTMLLILIQAPDGSVLWKIASGKYFEYDFLTTIIWCIEIGSTTWYNGIIKSSFTLEHLMELILAIYFVYDCIDQYMDNKNGNQNRFEDILSLIFNIGAYGYASYECALCYERRNNYTPLP